MNTESVAKLPPFGPIEGQKWFDRISSQWESQKNRFALIYFGKIRFLPPCIWNIPFMSYSLCSLYSTRVVQEGGRRCKKSTLNDLVHLIPPRIPLMNPPHRYTQSWGRFLKVRWTLQRYLFRWKFSFSGCKADFSARKKATFQLKGDLFSVHTFS